MADKSKLHIVMFPWLAFGHMIPFLELAKLIALKGHKISFISTPRNIDRLPKIPATLKPMIDFVKFPLPRVDNLPENAEATTDLPYKMQMHLKIAFDRLQEPVTLFLKSSSPDWVILDFASYWLSPIVSDLEIRSVYFSIFLAAVLSFVGPPELEDNRMTAEDFAAVPKWVPFETNVRMRLFQVRRNINDLAGDGGGTLSGVDRLKATINGCNAVAVRTCTELEPEWLNLLQNMYKKPVIQVGVLPSTPDDENSDEKWTEIKGWLDKRDKGSVVYVAFGSETKPSQTELTQLALGLEKSGFPFFWVLKKQLEFADSELNELPEGFEDRTKDRGVVYMTWVPQPNILSHDSVGSLLSHAGASSMVEAVQFGKSLIVLPFLGDQGLAASLWEEKNMAYTIPMDELDGSFTSDSVAESVRLVMVEEKGKVYRDKVKELMGAFGNKDIQDFYISDLLKYLET